MLPTAQPYARCEFGAFLSTGMRHPLSHLRGHAVGLLRAAGVRVDVLGEVGCRTAVEDQLAAQQACLSVNEVRV